MTATAPAINPAHVRVYLAACERALNASRDYYALPRDAGAAAKQDALATCAELDRIAVELRHAIARGHADPAEHLTRTADETEAHTAATGDTTFAGIVAARRVAARLLRATEAMNRDF